MVKRIYKYLIYKLIFLKTSSFTFRSFTKKEKSLILQLRREVESISLEEYQDATSSWLKNMSELKYHILNDDVRQFLSWEVIKYTMYLGGTEYILNEYRALNKSSYRDQLKYVLKENKMGNPDRFYFLRKSSGNLIHHAYHTLVYYQNTQEKIQDKDFVLEFGGGYGSMSRLFHQMGFKGKYIIFDLPIFSALQRYYLSSLNLKILNVENFSSATEGILCISSLDELMKIIKNANASNSLFLATWSLSESPIDIRLSIEPILSKFKSFLIGYQFNFEGINNIDYFTSLQKRLKNYLWSTNSISHLKNNFYLIGIKKK